MTVQSCVLRASGLLPEPLARKLQVMFGRRALVVFIHGLSSGLPLLLIGSTLKAWMQDDGVDLVVIGIFGLTGLPYTLKFLWAPLLDRFAPPLLDRRRGWILIFQLGLVVLLAAAAFSNPGSHPHGLAIVALLIALFSASQDIGIDAYRRELLPERELGFGAALGVNGYRVGMLLGGAAALPIADRAGWQVTYLTMAALMGVGIVATLLGPAVAATAGAPRTLQEAVVAPFRQFFESRGRRLALAILAFILLFKLGDQMASEMLTPFYLDLGFTKTAVGAVAKLFGFWATILGGLVGGLAMLRIGAIRALWIFGALQAISTGSFALLAHIGPHVPSLAAVVTFEALASGMGSTAYVAYMMSLCDKRFTATQYALFSSLMGVPRVVFGASSGYLAQTLGWSGYFVFCTLIAVPGMLLLLVLTRGRQPAGEGAKVSPTG